MELNFPELSSSTSISARTEKVRLKGQTTINLAENSCQWLQT